MSQTPRDLVVQVEEALLTWVYPQRKLLAGLVAEHRFDEVEREKALARLTEAAAATLGVARTSIWRLRKDGSAIDCVHLYERDADTHTSGAVIRKIDAPQYFEARLTPFIGYISLKIDKPDCIWVIQESP